LMHAITNYIGATITYECPVSSSRACRQHCYCRQIRRLFRRKTASDELQRQREL